MSEKGLMRESRKSDLLGGMSTFMVTDAGLSFLRKSLP